jgi:hypothetical protein
VESSTELSLPSLDTSCYVLSIKQRVKPNSF